MNVSRRSFIKRTATNTVGVASIPLILSSCLDEKKEKKRFTLFNDNDVVLFQGDSITDAGREKKNQKPNHAGSLGRGYAFLAASFLMGELATKNLTIYNRGISGNKVYQLNNRWKEDCLDIQPSILSILIGVNDFWHMKNGNYDGDLSVYENDYRNLLKRTKEQLPGIKFVVCEPFALAGGSAVDQAWADEFKAYQVAAKKLAKEFDTLFVPFQKIFDEARNYAPSTYWSGDGVHPSMAGAYLMAKAWLEVVN